MISPTMMMETEVDTDTETQEESDERSNIYEEVLNSDTCRRRHGRTKLAATSSIYRNSWWEGSAGRYQVMKIQEMSNIPQTMATFLFSFSSHAISKVFFSKVFFSELSPKPDHSTPTK